MPVGRVGCKEVCWCDGLVVYYTSKETVSCLCVIKVHDAECAPISPVGIDNLLPRLGTTIHILADLKGLRGFDAQSPNVRNLIALSSKRIQQVNCDFVIPRPRPSDVGVCDYQLGDLTYFTIFRSQKILFESWH